MKKLITLAALILAISTATFATAYTNGGNYAIIFDNIDLQYTVGADSDASSIITATYSKSDEYFHINTKEVINFLQVLDIDGELIYQLPIGSKKLNLSMEDFDKGTYTVNLLFEENDKVLSTELTKKI